MGRSRLQSSFELAHVRLALGAQVQHQARCRGNYVAARAACGQSRRNGDAAARVIESGDARHLQRHFVHGVDAVLGIQAGVCGAAGDEQFRGADALAAGFEAAVEAAGRFENQYGVTAERLALDERARSGAAGLFVGSPQKYDAPPGPPGALSNASAANRAMTSPPFMSNAPGPKARPRAKRKGMVRSVPNS